MTSINNLIANPSAGELGNTKDFHQFTECNINSEITSKMTDYVGRPVSINDGVVVPYNDSSFYGLVTNDVGLYGIGVDTKSISISQKGIRWARSEDGLKNGDLVKITGTGATAIFSKALPTEASVGKAVDKTIIGNEGYTITKIAFNCDFITATNTEQQQA
jgi:hypothetical protein